MPLKTNEAAFQQEGGFMAFLDDRLFRMGGFCLEDSRQRLRRSRVPLWEDNMFPRSVSNSLAVFLAESPGQW